MDPDHKFAHPIYWAPFVVVGEGGAAQHFGSTCTFASSGSPSHGFSTDGGSSRPRLMSLSGPQQKLHHTLPLNVVALVGIDYLRCPLASLNNTPIYGMSKSFWFGNGWWDCLECLVAVVF